MPTLKRVKISGIYDCKDDACQTVEETDRKQSARESGSNMLNKPVLTSDTINNDNNNENIEPSVRISSTKDSNVTYSNTKLNSTTVNNADTKNIGKDCAGIEFDNQKEEQYKLDSNISTSTANGWWAGRGNSPKINNYKQDVVDDRNLFDHYPFYEDLEQDALDYKKHLHDKYGEDGVISPSTQKKYDFLIKQGKILPNIKPDEVPSTSHRKKGGNIKKG